MRVVWICLWLSLAACSQGTFVHLDLQGAAPEGMVGLELDLLLAGNHAQSRIARSGISLPSDAVIEISQGQGALEISARLVDEGGAPGAHANGTATVVRGATTEATLVFTPETIGGANPGTQPPSGPGPAIGPGALRFDPDALDFGIALIGQTGNSRVFRLINDGAFPSAPVTISVVGADAAAFVIDDNTCQDVALLGGGECAITLSFHSTQAGPHVASLVATSAGTDFTAGLSGEALMGGALSIDASAHDFGSLAVGATDALHTFTITNTGDVTTGALMLAFSGTDAAAFTVEATSCQGALAPSASCDVTVRFLANAIGMRTATLVVSATPGDAVVAQLSATATVRLTVVKQQIAGATGLVVSGQPGLIDCGATCAADVGVATVILHAQPSAGFYFGGWSGDCTGFDDCALTMTQSRNVTARFSPANKMFTTSLRATIGGLKALGGAGSSGQKMQQGADAFCAQRAQAAGLSGTYRAFVSSSAGNALQRMIVSGARGWLRTDGNAFGDSLAAMFDVESPQIFSAPRIDEFGAVIPLGATAYTMNLWTGTAQDGTTANNCADWASTSSGQTAAIGTSTDGAGLFVFNDVINFNCSMTAADYRVLCMQVDYTVRVAPPPPPAPSRELFVTAGTYLPSQGLAGADAYCMAEAAQALRPGTYKAVLATATQPMKTRFVADARPVVRPDGVVISASAQDLLNDVLRNAAFSVDLFGEYHPMLNQEYFVWSGAQTFGGLDGRTCLDWTSASAADSGLVGRANGVYVGLSYTASDCNIPHALYCLEE